MDREERAKAKRGGGERERERGSWGRATSAMNNTGNF